MSGNHSFLISIMLTMCVHASTSVAKGGAKAAPSSRQISKSEKKIPDPYTVFTDIFDKECLDSEALVVHRIKQDGRAEGLVHVYFRNPRKKGVLRNERTREDIERVGLKPGMRICWTDESGGC